MPESRELSIRQIDFLYNSKAFSNPEIRFSKIEELISMAEGLDEMIKWATDTLGAMTLEGYKLSETIVSVRPNSSALQLIFEVPK